MSVCLFLLLLLNILSWLVCARIGCWLLPLHSYEKTWPLSPLRKKGRFQVALGGGLEIPDGHPGPETHCPSSSPSRTLWRSTRSVMTLTALTWRNAQPGDGRHHCVTVGRSRPLSGPLLPLLYNWGASASPHLADAHIFPPSIGPVSIATSTLSIPCPALHPQGQL